MDVLRGFGAGLSHMTEDIRRSWLAYINFRP